MHMRTKHNVRPDMRYYVDGSGRCPVCLTVLHTRLRVLRHLWDKRRNIACRKAIVDGAIARLETEEVEALDDLDKAERKAAKATGHTRPIARGAARKHSGKLTGRAAQW